MVLAPPAAPMGPLEVFDVLADQCKLSWKAPFDDGGSPIKEYNVELLDPKTKKWRRVGKCKPDPPFKHPVEDLVEGEEYKFRVNAVNDEGESEWLESDKPIKAKNPFGPPMAPQNVQIIKWHLNYKNMIILKHTCINFWNA